MEDMECRHGLDARWCGTCRAPAVPVKRVAAARARRPAQPHRELTAADYGLPAGTPFVDSFRGDHGFLSNFARSDIDLDGETYRTVEHAFQAAKTDVASERERLRNTPSPLIVKRLGKKVTLRPGWDAMRVQVMGRFLRAKFCDPDLAAKLLATGDMPLYEGNHWGDTFWGTVDGRGQNHLGRLLMEIRAELRASAEPT